MATLQQSFAAYRKNIMSDEELAICLKAIEDLNATLDALDERGYHRNGYLILEHSLRSMTDSRARDRLDQNRARSAS
jgi:hypothetical protein